METQRRTSSRRRALADCTNTLSAASRRKISQPTTVPPKPSHGKSQPQLQPKPMASNSSLKTTTSTGSNNPPIVDSALSIPRNSSDHHAPTNTILSDSAGRDPKKIGPSTVQSRKDEKTWKDKGNRSLETPIIQASKPMVRKVTRKSSSTDAGNCVLPEKTALEDQIGKIVKDTLVKINKRSTLDVPLKSSLASSGDHHLMDPPAVENKKLESAKMKDNGKNVPKIPVFETTGLTKPHVPVASSPAASTESLLSGLPAVRDQQLDAEKRKDKGKEVLELPIIEITDPFIRHISQASTSAASDNLDAQTSKDKGRTSLGTLNIETTELLRLHMSQASSSAVSDTVSPAVQIQKMDAEKRKDNGKTVLDTSNIETADHLRPHKSHASGPSTVQKKKPDAQKRRDKRKSVEDTQNLETSSLAVSGSRYLLRTPMVKYQKTDAAKGNKPNMARVTSDIEATDPSTPQAPMASLSSAGTRDQEKLLFSTVYGQRRAPARRKHADRKSSSFSCPPNKRAKNIGMATGDDHGKKKSGSHTDPTHKKSRKGQDAVHQMPQDEIEKLIAYYKEIDDFDEFELLEVSASDSD